MVCLNFFSPQSRTICLKPFNLFSALFLIITWKQQKKNPSTCIINEIKELHSEGFPWYNQLTTDEKIVLCNGIFYLLIQLVMGISHKTENEKHKYIYRVKEVKNSLTKITVSLL